MIRQRPTRANHSPVNTASATPALAGPQAIVEGEIGGVNDQQGQASVRVAGSILKNADNSRPRFVAALRGKLATGTRVRVRQLVDGTWEIFEIIS